MIAPVRRSAVSVCVVSTLVAFFLAACGGSPTAPSQSQPTTPPAPARTLTAVQVSGSASLSEGKTAQLTAQATYSDASTENVSTRASWKSSDPRVATVSATGLVTAVSTGTADVTADFQGQSGRRTLQIARARMTVAVQMRSITALDTCDDVFQGLDRGEFAFRVRLVTADGGQFTAEQSPSDYPGNPSSLRGVSLARNASVSLSGEKTYSLPAEAGQFVRVELNATEWDEQIVIIPPSTRWIHDSRLDDRGVTRTHQVLERHVLEPRVQHADGWERKLRTAARLLGVGHSPVGEVRTMTVRTARGRATSGPRPSRCPPCASTRRARRRSRRP